MNASRRSKIKAIVKQLEQLKDEIEDVQFDEQDSFDNLPEGLQCSYRGERMEDAISSMDSAMESIETAIDELNSAMS